MKNTRKLTKLELIEEIAEDFKSANVFKMAMRESQFTSMELCKELAFQMLQKLSFCLHELNMLHNDKYVDEWRSCFTFRDNLKNSEFDYKSMDKATEYFHVVDCIINYGENYHKDYI